MSEKAAGGDWIKWVVGVIVSLLAAGGGIVALLGYFAPHPSSVPVKPPVERHQEAPLNVTETFCVAGKVFDEETYAPLPNVKVGYLTPTQKPEDEMKYLVTTGPDGAFEADCSHIVAQSFPIRLQLRRTGWPAAVTTDEYVERGISNKSINVYVRDTWLKTPAIDTKLLRHYRPKVSRFQLKPVGPAAEPAARE